MALFNTSANSFLIKDGWILLSAFVFNVITIILENFRIIHDRMRVKKVSNIWILLWEYMWPSRALERVLETLKTFLDHAVKNHYFKEILG